MATLLKRTIMAAYCHRLLPASATEFLIRCLHLEAA
jgi:hypothetical protein